MKVQLIMKLFIITSLIVCVHSLSIRDFTSKEIGDVEPDYTEYAAVARYVVNKSEWTSIGTVSTLKSIDGFPMVNVKSIVNIDGHIYFYLTDADFTGQDLLKINKLTVLFSNDQDLECTKKGVDPMEPTCARIMISGSAIKLDINSEEYNLAKKKFLSHHPAAVNWIKQHLFYLCKLDITQIIIIDWYGGAKYVTAEDYYQAKSSTNGFLDFGRSSKSIQLINNDSDFNERPNIAVNNENEKKIKIQINKGSDVVTIEL